MDSPLIYAIITRNKELIIEYATDEYINIPDIHGNTPLMTACLMNDTDTIQILLSFKSCAVNLRNLWGQSVLSCANIHPNLIEILLERDDVNIDITDRSGMTTLMKCVVSYNKKLLNALMGRNANVNIQDNDGQSALHIAVRINNVDFIEALLENDRVQIDAQDKYGMTPIMIASRYGYAHVVRLLISKQCSVNLVDKKFRSALYIANKYNHIAISNMLKMHDAKSHHEMKRVLLFVINRIHHTPYNLYRLLKRADVLKQIGHQ